ncbi:hypothetical protein [Jatrophihabitans sp.]|uniref:hypothetical protein n=1 Tax=Jatrophihabitans sp. TaxID=1932789 RepID=UPI002C6BBDE8|nr:hypothetical protein [Jatrophihabitans sp.]
MRNKIVYAASAAAVVLGAGTAALAASGGGVSPVSAGPDRIGSAALLAAAPANPAPGASQAPGPAGHGPKAGRPGLRALERALHAQWVTRKPGSPGSFVTHDAIRGEVTAVSATSITVKALDGVSQTYAVTGSTKVHLRKAATGNGKGRGGTPGTIGDVHTGDQVAVAGTGTSSLTAEHIVDRVD